MKSYKAGKLFFYTVVVTLIKETVLNLFESILAEPINILPKDGVANFHGEIMSIAEADFYYNVLLKEIDWRCDKAIIFGKLIETKRKVAWYAGSKHNKPFSYTYSNTTKYSLPWTQTLYSLKKLIEDQTKETYNSCLLNLYHSGAEGMAWHSDGENDLKNNGAIASLSFGAVRKFSFKHKQSKEVVSILLKPSSLLVMKGLTQKYWLHRLPPTKKISEPRINLTFRTIDQENQL